MPWGTSKEFFYDPSVDIDYRASENEVRKVIGSDFVWTSEDDPEYISEKNRIDKITFLTKGDYRRGLLAVGHGVTKDGKDRWLIATPDGYNYIAKRINEEVSTIKRYTRKFRISESNSNNIGNLLIGQEIGVKVTDASGVSFIRNMEVGEIYPAGEVLLRDSESGNTVVFEFDDQASNKLLNGLVYKNLNPEVGISCEFVISSEGNSNESITRQVLGESKKVNLAPASRLTHIIKSNQ